MECAILGEWEREEADFIVSASQVRGQFAAEEFGITARYEYLHFAPEQPIYEEVPPVHVLNLVQKEVGNIRPVKLIYAR